MSILSRFWDHNRNTIGNVAKDISPLLAFTPLGPLGSAAAGALGQAAIKGSNIGSIAKAGISNGAIGLGAESGVGALRSALSSGVGDAAAAGADASGAIPAGVPFDGEAASFVPASAPAASSPSALSRALSFADTHANTIGNGLTAAGKLAEGQQNNALAKQQLALQSQQTAAQDAATAASTAASTYALDQQKKRDAALDPLRQSLFLSLAQRLGS